MARCLVAAGLLLAVGLSLPGGPLRAADPQGYYTIQGVGLESCEVWLSERRSDGPTAWYHQQWVLGYLTAYNRWVHNGDDVTDGIETDKLFNWLDEYCHRNPQQNLSLATEALSWALRER